MTPATSARPADRLQGQGRRRRGRRGARRRQDLRRPGRRAQPEAGRHRPRPGHQGQDRRPGGRRRRLLRSPRAASAASSTAQFGPVIVRVSNDRAGGRHDLRRGQGPAQEGDRHRAGGRRDRRPSTTSIEDARAGGATLAEVAAKYGLKLVTVPAVDQPGKDPTASRSPTCRRAWSRPPSQTDVGLENDPIQPDAQQLRLVRRHRGDRRRTTARSPRCATRWSRRGRTTQRQKKLDAQADDLKAQARPAARTSPRSPPTPASTVKTADKLTRVTQPTGDLSAAAITAAFDGPKGYVAVADGADADDQDRARRR